MKTLKCDCGRKVEVVDRATWVLCPTCTAAIKRSHPEVLKTVEQRAHECTESIMQAIIVEGEAGELGNEIMLRVMNAINMALVAKCEPTGRYARGKDAETS